MRRLPLPLLPLLLLAGCALPTLQDVPLPGLVHGPTRVLAADFPSALNLPPQAPVKLHGTVIGSVDALSARGYHARVTMDVLDSVLLHDGVRAEIRLTLTLSTSYVALTDGTGPALPAGAVIPLAQTAQAPDVSDLLSALSIVVTGGPFGDLRTIITELNQALTGHTGDVRRLLRQLDDTAGFLNAQTTAVDASIDELRRLSAQLVRDRHTIAQGLEQLTPAIRVLGSQRAQLLTLLGRLHAFSDAGAGLLRASGADLVRTATSLGPVLDALLRNRANLRPLMRNLVAFSQGTADSTRGIFTNFDLFLSIDPGALTLPGARTPAGAQQPPVPSTQTPGRPAAHPPGPAVPPHRPGLPLPTTLPSLRSAR